MTKQQSVLFVCMGNICRSPTAHALMQHKVNQRKLNTLIHIDSAGTHAYHVGNKADPRSRQLAKDKGVDMDYLRARKISVTDYDQFDYILAMDNDNLDLLKYYAPNKPKAKIAHFLSFAHLAKQTEALEVPDPYYGGALGFENVFSLVDIGCDALIEHILQSNDTDSV